METDADPKTREMDSRLRGNDARREPGPPGMRAGCPDCHGTGWKRVVMDGVERMYRCTHGKGSLAPAFEPVGDVLKRLAETGVIEDVDQKLAAEIRERQGAAQAITIAELATRLWPDDWADPKQRPSIERGIKASVARLRLNGKLLIGSSRSKPYGYYMITTRAELDENREHSRHHLVAWARQFRSFDPDGQEARRLYGELALELGVSTAEHAENAEMKGGSESGAPSDAHGAGVRSPELL